MNDYMQLLIREGTISANLSGCLQQPITPEKVATLLDGVAGLSRKETGIHLKEMESQLMYRWPALGQTEREIVRRDNVSWVEQQVSRLSGRPWKPGLGPAFVLGA